MKEDNIFDNNIIKIGQNAIENDKLIDEASQTDIWFHLNNLPSCHIIIKCSNDNPITNQMIYYCANLCKENTKYKNYKKLKVMYTEIKNVKKTVIPGKVTIKGKYQIVAI